MHSHLGNDIFSEAHDIKVRENTCPRSISTTTNHDIFIKQMTKYIYIYVSFHFHIA